MNFINEIGYGERRTLSLRRGFVSLAQPFVVGAAQRAASWCWYPIRLLIFIVTALQPLETALASRQPFAV